MMKSLISTVGLWILYLLLLTCITLLCSLRSDLLLHRISSNAAKLGSVWTLLRRRAILAPEIKEQGRNDVVGARRYVGRPGEECRVCLSEVEQGEEIGELRCCHVYHKGCIDAWVGSGRATCPVCRGLVFAPSVADDGGSDVILFQFFCCREREPCWWLR